MATERANGNFFSNLLMPLALAVLAAFHVWSTLNGKQLPLISSPRSALIALLVIGMAMCSAGIGQVAASNRWASPLAILGYLLGSALLVVFISTLAGWNLPMIQSDNQAVLIAAALMGAKTLIATVGYIFRLF